MSIPVWDTEEQKAINAKWRRERIAVAAMQGLLAARPPGRELASYFIAQDAVKFADALIDELDGRAS